MGHGVEWGCEIKSALYGTKVTKYPNRLEWHRTLHDPN
jgi:hypothetical protein